METTNVTRLLKVEGIPFQTHSYDAEITDGMKVAEAVGKDPDSTFKTLVCQAASGEYLAFMVPVSSTLDLKKGAAVAMVKSIQMIKQKDLLPLTGYVHGGCSPIGMKKSLRTFIEESAQLYNTICFSAGRRGCQVEMAPNDLITFISAHYADLV